MEKGSAAILILTKEWIVRRLRVGTRWYLSWLLERI